MAFFLVCRFYGGLQVSQVIQAVENTDDINSVCNGFLNEVFYNVVCIRTLSQVILSAEQHLQLRILKSVAQLAESFPRIFMQET